MLKLINDEIYDGKGNLIKVNEEIFSKVLGKLAQNLDRVGCILLKRDCNIEEKGFNLFHIYGVQYEVHISKEQVYIVHCGNMDRQFKTSLQNFLYQTTVCTGNFSYLIPKCYNWECVNPFHQVHQLVSPYAEKFKFQSVQEKEGRIYFSLPPGNIIESLNITGNVNEGIHMELTISPLKE